MSTKIVSCHLNLSSLTQAEEDTLATTLSGLSAFSSTIWNNTLGVTRYWNGSAFVTMTGDISSLKITTGNQTTTSNVAGNITDLIYPVQANSVYTFSGIFKISCSSTGGVKFAIVIPASATIAMNLLGSTTVNTALIPTNIVASATLGTAYCTEAQTRAVLVNGTITTGATAGTVQFQFASGTDTQTSTILQEGTFLRIQNVTN